MFNNGILFLNLAHKYSVNFKNPLKSADLIRLFLITCLALCHNLKLCAQFFDDFSDSNLNANPVWEGNLDHFIVNSEEQLQLNAPDGGSSQIFTQLIMPDSIVWQFEAELDFSPSDNNKLRIYLAINNIVIEQASGYFIEIGENGGDDALNFYFLDQGLPQLLASGSLGALGGDPAFLKAKITYFPQGDWTFEVAYEANAPLEQEIIVSNSDYDFTGNQIFLVECVYTASRTDRFFFDYIGIEKFEFDRSPPSFFSATVVDAVTIEVQANEVLNEASILNLNNYSISGLTGQPISAELINNDTGIRLGLSEALESGTIYNLSIEGVQDVNENASDRFTFDLFLIDEASPGDLIVNEILFNPETDGSDFVEILNISDKFIFLGNLDLVNSSKSEEKPIETDLVLKPGEYLAITEDVPYLIDRYETPDSARFLDADIPSFNNDEGNVSIINRISGDVIDAFDYSEDLHFQELDDVNGVSLERISPFSATDAQDNWFSASAAVKFASPGYRNSNFLDPSLSGDELIEFESKTFSPNQDGMDDQLIIKYALPSSGYLVDVNIFDQGGRKVKTLVNNVLLSNEGFVLWDGINDEGESANIGIYYVLFEAFNENGDVLKTKKAAILADFLD